MRKTCRFFSIAAIVAASIIACDPYSEDVENQKEQQEQQEKEEKEQQQQQQQSSKPSAELQQADQFAIDALSVYYLWNNEVKKDLARLDPDTCKVPMTVVEEIRYHKSGKEVDHWTSLTNNLGEMTSSVEGLGLSFGYDLTGMWVDATHTALVFIVNYVVKDKPADKAGLKRGDIIWQLNGNDITLENYYDLFNSSSMTIIVQPGIDAKEYKSISMDANNDWENPILLSKTFDIDGKKVGYLVYNSFDVKSMETLPDVFREFKADGVKELILDLRYNGGGFTATECELASLIAPYASVSSNAVFQTEVYNSILTEAWKDEDFNTYFSTKHEYKSGDYNISQDISDANIDATKLYAIVTGGSASASEGLLIGLGPYVDITLIGEQTYGKYCAGYMMSPANMYGSQSTVDYSEIEKWGIYVMVSTFADKNGNNSAMPDGIPVNIEAEDNVFDGYQLGDENETMLKAALTAAGKVYSDTQSSVSTRSVTMSPVCEPALKSPKPRGILIKNDLPELDITKITGEIRN